MVVYARTSYPTAGSLASRSYPLAIYLVSAATAVLAALSPPPHNAGYVRRFQYVHGLPVLTPPRSGATPARAAGSLPFPCKHTVTAAGCLTSGCLDSADYATGLG